MAKSVVLAGAAVKLYIGGSLYQEVVQLRYVIDYGEEPIYGIDSMFPQEIAVTRVAVQGSVQGLKIKLSGDLQGRGGARPKINELLIAPYVSIKIVDRSTNTDLLFIPQAKVTQQDSSVAAKGVMTINFQFKGIIPYTPVDLNG